jgi:hypothetical protein
MKEETLEEVAERLYPIRIENGRDWNEWGRNRFIEGAKWQQERSYSEEELKSAFKIGFNIGYGSPVQELDSKNEHCERWFKQFKKK